MSEPISITGLIRWGGISLIAGGATLTAFLLLHPYGEVAGAHAAHSARWVPAHTLHFAGALLTLFGLLGFYAASWQRLGRLGVAGFLVAFAGTAMFVGTGMLTAFIWPVVAQQDPGFIASNGPMFTNPMTRLNTDGTYAVMVAGYGLLGVAIWMHHFAGRVVAVPLVAGVLLFSAPVPPVGPAPWILRIIGAVLFGGALVWLGWTLVAGPPPEEAFA